MAAREANLALAEKIVKAMPAAIRNDAEVVDKPGKPYTIVKVRGASIASVRDGAVRIVHRTDGGAEAVKKLAALIVESAPEAKPEPKPKAEPKKSSAKKPPKDDDATGEVEGEKGDD